MPGGGQEGGHVCSHPGPQAVYTPGDPQGREECQGMGALLPRPACNTHTHTHTTEPGTHTHASAPRACRPAHEQPGSTSAPLLQPHPRRPRGPGQSGQSQVGGGDVVVLISSRRETDSSCHPEASSENLCLGGCAPASTEMLPSPGSCHSPQDGTVSQGTRCWGKESDFIPKPAD